MSVRADANDEALARAARGGDEEALRALFDRYRPPLEMLLLRSIPPSLRAKVSVSDVLQETYAAVWRSLADFGDQGPGSFRAWLVRIAKHRVVDAVRRYRAAARAVDREAGALERVVPEGVACPAPSPSSIVVAQELQERLRSSMPTLSDDHRTVLQLVLVEGLSLIEAGRRMGRSPNAVQKLFARAKDKLWALCMPGGAG